jgi:hypothetical protein
MSEAKRLLDMPRNRVVKFADENIEVKGVKGAEFKFFHIDGMYSYCETMDGDSFHLRFDTPVLDIRPIEART